MITQSTHNHPVWQTEFTGWQLIEASAGTGKTWTMASLFVRAIVEQGVGIESILTLTYTRAATDELKRRVAQALQVAYQAAQMRINDVRSKNASQTEITAAAQSLDPFTRELLDRADANGLIEQAFKRLSVALANVDRLAIYTLHGFGQRVVSAYSTSLGYSRESAIVTDSQTWLRPALDQYWRSLLRDASDMQSPLAQILVAKNLSPESLGRSFAKALDFPLAKVMVSTASPDSLVRDLHRTVQAMVAIEQTQWLDFGDWITSQPWDTRHANTKSTCRKNAIDLAQWLAADQLLASDKALKFLEKLSFDELTTGKYPVELPLQLDQRLVLCNQYLQALHALDSLTAVIAGRFRLWCQDHLVGIKRDLGLQTYDDALLALVNALQDPVAGRRLALDLAGRYPIAFIDESQDTDRVPWTIFNHVYRDVGTANTPAKCLIAVGDPKQSIYRFRGADVFEFLAIKKQVANPLTLTVNRRSTPPMIAAVNALFARDGVFRLEGLSFIDAQALPSGQLSDDQQPSLEWTWLGQGTKKLLIPRALKAVVDGVLHELSNGTDEGDIAILVSSNKQASSVRKALSRVGVTSVVMSRDSVLQSDEADELQYVLAAMVEPNDSGLLRAACATRLIGATAHDLAQAAVLENYRYQFCEWSKRFRLDGLFGGLRSGLAAMGCFEHLAHLRDGERRLTNLHQLLEQLREARPTMQLPSEALQWLVRSQADKVQSDQLELLLENDTKLVNIVTLHRSKGLEYRVVFMPFSWNAPNPKNKQWNQPFLDHPNSSDAVLDFRDPLPSDVQSRKTNDNAAESVRLFYVGVTRAKRKLYVCNATVAGAGPASSVELTIGANRQAVHDLCAMHPHLMQMRDFDLIDGPTTPKARVVMGREWELRATPTNLPQPWRFASYTSMVNSSKAAEFEQENDSENSSDRDAQSAAALNEHSVSAAPSPLPEGDNSIRESFVAGAQAGICLHTLLELQCFAAPFDPAQVANVLINNSIAADPAQVSTWLDQILAVPLRSDIKNSFTLNTIPDTHKLSEFEFMLSARDTDKTKLNAALHDITLLGGEVNQAAAQLPFGLNGLLRGFIDCVFESGGKYYVLDWKSNHLGDGLDAYSQTAMQAAMIAHRYDWQAALYLVALHRYLATSLAYYDPEQHLGGAWYIFLRAAGDTRRPIGAGLFHYSPPLSAILILDRALRS